MRSGRVPVLGAATREPIAAAIGRALVSASSSSREVYTGAIGFASPVAGLELSVAIRTLELSRGQLWIGAGGGIVADSDPAAEYEETLAKAGGFLAALRSTGFGEGQPGGLPEVNIDSQS